MSAMGSGSQPVLVYNRIEHNRRKTWLLVAMSVMTLAPFVVSLSYLMSSMVVWRVRSETRHTRAVVRTDRRHLQRVEAERTRTEWDQWVERDLEQRQAALVKMEAADRELTLKLMPVFA